VHVNISSSFQTYSVTAMRLSITEPQSTTATSPAPARTAGGDAVTLSLEASSADPTPPTRGELLLSVLDADADDSVTTDEFTEGALALLKRDAPGRANDEGRGQRGVPGLERRLEKAFTLVDGDRDGSLDAGELTAAIDGARGGVDDRDQDEVAVPPPSPEPVAEPAATLSVTAFSVAYVSVAVYRYTSLQPSVAQPPVASGASPVSAASAGEIEDPAPRAPVAA
jgi:hypothetical protein